MLKTWQVGGGKWYNFFSKVGEFSKGDIGLIGYVIDGVSSNTAPDSDDGYDFESATCDDQNVVVTWDSVNWGLLLTNLSGKVKCTLNFVTHVEPVVKTANKLIQLSP